MCLAIPMQLESRDEFSGSVALDGVRRTVSMVLLPEAEPGQWVLVHAGYAIAVVDEERARETLELLREIGEAMDAP